MEEFENLIATLKERGIRYAMVTPTCVSFDNDTGDCLVFPSQAQRGKLTAFYQGKKYCETADEALAVCGL